MNIDENIIKSGITPTVLHDLIYCHEKKRDKYIKMYNYYIGKHDILKRHKDSSGTANNKIVCNHAKYLIDIEKSYLTGNPITYSTSEGYDIEEVKNAYFEQGIESLDNDIVKDFTIFGTAVELVYADENGRPRSSKLCPLDSFICYSQTAEQKPLIGVYYYKTYDLKGVLTGTVCTLLDDRRIYIYKGRNETFSDLQLEEEREHYFGSLPMIEYKNNEERQSDIESVSTLIDAYNLLMSDRVNDKEQFVDSFLFLANLELDSKEAKKLKEEKILIGYEGSKAEYLSKVMRETDIKVLRDDIKEDIHRFSLVPDLSDESFGNNLSGVALKYKLLGLENSIKNKEIYMKKSLKRRFELYNNYLTVLNKMEHVPIHRITITFNYNLPANELELSQMITNLKGTVSDETLLSCLPFVDDEKEEAEIVRREKAEDYKRKIQETEELARGGGY